MNGKALAAALVGAILFSVPAFAQSTPQSDVSAHTEGQWRSSKMVGLNVYNDANEKIGAIDDLLTDKSGKIDKVIISVGGFLGIGEHRVAVPMDKLKWVDEPVRAAAVKTPGMGAPATNVDSNAKTAAGGTPPSTTGTGTDRPARATSERWYPDHAVYSATKDEVKAMPEFKY